MTRPNQDLVLIALTVLAGSLLPLQALINGRLGGHPGSPLWASATQNLVGALSMFCVIVILRPAFPTAGQIGAVPMWGWLGGSLGMVFVFAGLVAAPRLGAAPAMVGVICGQLLSSLALDHFGVLHARRPIDAAAVVGTLLLVGGAVLILRRA